MEASQKQMVIVVSVVILLLLIAFYITYRMGKKTVEPSKLVITDDIVGTTTLTDAQKKSLKTLAVALRDDMSGISPTWSPELYTMTNTLSDTELNALSNIFNVLYQNDSGDTFYQWILGENFAFQSFILQAEVDVLINRMNAIGIQ